MTGEDQTKIGYRIEKCIDIRESGKNNKGRIELLIRWKGMSSSSNSWEYADQMSMKKLRKALAHLKQNRKIDRKLVNKLKDFVYNQANFKMSRNKKDIRPIETSGSVVKGNKDIRAYYQSAKKTDTAKPKSKSPKSKKTLQFRGVVKEEGELCMVLVLKDEKNTIVERQLKQLSDQKIPEYSKDIRKALLEETEDLILTLNEKKQRLVN